MTPADVRKAADAIANGAPIPDSDHAREAVRAIVVVYMRMHGADSTSAVELAEEILTAAAA